MLVRNRLLVVAVCVAASLGTAQAAAPAAGAASAAQVRELMDVVGTPHLMSQMMAQMTTIMARALPCVPQATLNASFGSHQAQNELINKMIPVYQQQFTSADIKGLLAFYRSPLGQKMVKTQPAIMQQGMQIGQQWGQEHARAMVADLTKQGVLDAQGQCKAAAKPVVPGASSK